MKRRKGHQVEYQGKKYDSLSELSKDLELPYSCGRCASGDYYA